MCELVTKQAPDFTAQAVMPDNTIGELNLSDYRGKYVILFFYPLDFTFVCPSEIIAFDKKLDAFKEKGCEVLGVVSGDALRLAVGVVLAYVAVYIAVLGDGEADRCGDDAVGLVGGALAHDAVGYLSGPERREPPRLGDGLAVGGQYA